MIDPNIHGPNTPAEHVEYLRRQAAEYRRQFPEPVQYYLVDAEGNRVEVSREEFQAAAGSWPDDAPLQVSVQPEAKKPEVDEPQHTPGPWDLAWEDGKYGVIASAVGGKLVAVVGNNPNDGLNDIRKANAKLMASAPDMLEQIKRLTTERDNWRVSFANLATVERELLEENERLVKRVVELESEENHHLRTIGSYNTKAGAMEKEIVDMRAKISLLEAELAEKQKYILQLEDRITPTEPLDAPDGPGWWIFQGAERESRPILPEGYADWEAFSDRWRGKNCQPVLDYEDGLGEPFQAVLEVRWVQKGQSICEWRRSGPHHGEPVLGFVSHKYRWNHALYSPNTVVGKWWRVALPQEEA